MNGVTYDGQHVWFASGEKLNGFDPLSGEMLRSIDVAAHAGTAFDGQHLFPIADLDRWVCSREFPIPIPPHTCASETANQLPSHFTRNLAESYEPPPGVYYVVRSAKLDANMCRTTTPRLDPAALADKLRFSIEPD